MEEEAVIRQKIQECEAVIRQLQAKDLDDMTADELVDLNTAQAELEFLSLFIEQEEK